MTEFLFSAAVLFIGATLVAAQGSPPCSTEKAKQFDFWIGTWDLEWVDAQGQKQKGTNTINKILGGCVIEENFSTVGANPYLGKSHSVYDAASGKWKQTWVDSGGGYLDFRGGFDGGTMTLSREGTDPKGNKIMQRMVFSEIRNDSILWDWESSADNGKTWKNNWKINYKKKK
jgi:hypothetical protein